MCMLCIIWVFNNYLTSYSVYYGILSTYDFPMVFLRCFTKNLDFPIYHLYCSDIGKGNALLVGFKNANYDTILMTDADDEYAITETITER